MSVASVTNKTLQLSELVISNEKFTGATGYVASSSSFSSSVDSTSLTTSIITLPNDCVLTSNASGELLVNAEPVGGATGATGATGAIGGAGFAVGVKLITLNLVNFPPQTSTTFNSSIPNFVGTSNTAYCATINYEPATLFLLGIAAGTPSGGSTPITLVYTNISSDFITENLIIGVIAVTPP